MRAASAFLPGFPETEFLGIFETRIFFSYFVPVFPKMTKKNTYILVWKFIFGVENCGKVYECLKLWNLKNVIDSMNVA